MEAPHTDLRSSAPRELSRLGDINFAGKPEDSVLTIDGGGFKFETMSLSKISDVVTSNNNLGFGGALASVTGSENIAIGSNAGTSVSTNGSVLIGRDVGLADVGADSVVVGGVEGSFFPNATAQLGCGTISVVIGHSALGATTAATRGALATVVGGGAAYNGCGPDCVYVGAAAGAYPQTHLGVTSVGANSGSQGLLGENSVSVGRLAGGSSTGTESVSVGYTARASGDRSVCIGSTSVSNVDSVCVGQNSSSGDNSVVVGGNVVGVGANDSVTLNGSSASINAVANGFVVTPMQGLPVAQTSSENHVILPTTASGFTQLLVRHPTTGEVRYVTLATIP